MKSSTPDVYDLNPDPWKDFYWSETDEPHASRRKEILKKHPEIATLFRPEPLTAVVVAFISILQLTVAYIVRDWSWGPFLLATYVISGTVNHTLQLAAHEVSHNLAFYSPKANRVLAICCNFVTGFPSGSTFRRYHMLHHQQQGVHGVDMDVPTALEAKIVGTQAWRKLVWMFLQPLFYSLRPAIMKPLQPNRWELINIVCQVSFNVLVAKFMGFRALMYMALGTILGMGLHPAAGHFVAEHYVFLKGHETYSYYGFCNYLNLNVGYHNEHHDFPRIPWTLLPQVKQMAPEYYDNLPFHTSYIRVVWDYITDNTMGPFSRTKRLQSGSDMSERVAICKKTNEGRKASTTTAQWVGAIAAVVLILGVLMLIVAFGVSGM